MNNETPKNSGIKGVAAGLSLFLLIQFSPGAFSASVEITSYDDVTAGAWYQNYVETLQSTGLIDEGRLFRPNAPLTRAELVKLVILALGGLKDDPLPPTPTFDDVPHGVWFSGYIEEATTRGIVMGYSDERGNLTGQFGPGDPVTRAAAAKILVNAFELAAIPEKKGNFPDVDIADWFYDDVKIASQHGVMSGYESGYFGPSAPVTRAQMAKMLVLGAKASPLQTIFTPDSAPEESGNNNHDENTNPLPGNNDEEEEIKNPELPDAIPNPASLETSNIDAGTSDALVARYSFRANNEGFRVETLTVVNDITGEKLGDQPTGSTAIKNIILKFPDKNGKLASVTSPLSSDGTARFSNLTFFAKRDTDSFLEVYAKLNKLSDIGPSLSGEVFRVGLKDINNTEASFRAVGDISNFVMGYNSGKSFSVSSSHLAPFTVRKSIPHFSLSPISQSMSNGTNTLFAFSIQSSASGSVGLARLVFEVNVSDDEGSDLSLSNFQLFRGSQSLNHVMIYDATGQQNLSTEGGQLHSGTSFVIVSFQQEESIPAGSSHTYWLKATVNASHNNDSVSTRLVQDDENTPLTGLTDTGRENTGKIFVDADSASGIFTSVNDFSQTLLPGRNIIWSDKSAQPHAYPSFPADAPVSDSGSADWTNGHLLGLSGLEDQTLSK